jgi:raffinose/stachyose/melibiose transport system substrate-binding protein
VQLWYDQYMSSKMAEVHKDTCQALFGLTMTPEEVCKAMQDAINAE